MLLDLLAVLVSIAVTGVNSDSSANYIYTYAGFGSGDSGAAGPANMAKLRSPVAFALDSSNSRLYFSDYYNNKVKYINTNTGYIYDFATGFKGPWGIALDNKNNLVYVADAENHVVKVINRTSGITSIFAGTLGVSGTTGDNGLVNASRLNYPNLMSLDSINNVLYIVDQGNNKIK
ncbi:hypothetical protein AKO1_004715 [Acrasis kona]|uniref:NHL repeat-containing protein n=1 Tax=Acrasis kona TaxID=1008807 RepID=A0AAW2YNB0_9EUKA